MSALTTFIQHSTGSLRAIRQKKKKNEKLPNQKDVKLSLLADPMIIDVENPKN